MIYDLFLYFFLILGIFYLLEIVLSVYFINKNFQKTYILTFYEKEDDLQKIVFLARNYPYTVIVYEANEINIFQKDYVKNKYPNVEFTSSLSDLQEEKWRKR